ncbi:MAG: sigma-54 dependent transcriptional regulator [Acidobacteriota bacterium]
MQQVLVIDDQPAVLDALRLLFEIHDIPCVTTSDPDEALALATGGTVGAVVQDMNFDPGETSGEQGIDLFRRLKQARPELPILLITAWTSLETAVQLVKEGATDYLAKPWDDRKLLETVRQLLGLGGAEAAEAEARGVAASRAAASGGTRDALAAEHELCGLIYRSDAMHRLVSLALHVAPSSVPVLITGPNGSGKEKLAEILRANSPRRRGSFVRVNVGALPEDLMEAELFGAEAGAYTGRRDLRIGRFEAADEGTLFLDEIDSLSLAGQVKLLRALESGEFSRLGGNRTRTSDARVITATNADLQAEIAAGRFREDLYFRINVVELRVPALRDRPEDIAPLAEHFVQQFAAERGAEPRPIGHEALATLIAYPWPGNVRELRNRLQRADLLATGPTIEPADFDLAGQPGAVAAPSIAAPSIATPSIATPSSAPPSLTPEALAERTRIERTLTATGGVVARAAEQLGISRQALYRKMSKLGLSIERRLSE